MINLNKMNTIHLLVKTHLEFLLQSVKPDIHDEGLNKNPIKKLEQLYLKVNENKEVDKKINEVILVDILLIKQALQLHSNTNKINTLQVIESIITDKGIDVKLKSIILPDIIEMIQFALQINEHSINTVILSIINGIFNLNSKECSLSGVILYDIFDICFDVYLKSINNINEENKKNACLTLEALINMLILKAKESIININNNPNKISQYQLLTKEKWLNKIQKEVLNKYMDYYLDIIEFDIKSLLPLKNTSFQLKKKHLTVIPKPSVNEKGIESGRYGFCINCRNQGNFYSFTYSFPFCSMKCFNEMLILINKVDITVTVENNPSNDLINLITILSQIISIDLQNTWEYKEITISQMKYYAMTFIYNILSHDLFENNIDSFIKMIKESLYPYVIIPFSLSSDYESFALANKIQLLLIESNYKIYFRQEIGQYVERVYLYYLRTEKIPINYKLIVIDTLLKLTDKSFANEVFLNYDCDMYSSNLYNQLLEIITKIIRGIYDKKDDLNLIETNDLISSDKNILRNQCLDLISQLIHQLDSIVESEQNENQINKPKTRIKKISQINIDITLENSSLIKKQNLLPKHLPFNRPTSESITNIISIKDCFKKAIEKFNINPLTGLKYLLLNNIIAPETEFNNYKYKYDNEPTSFIDRSEEEEEDLNSLIEENNTQFLFLQYLLKSHEKSKDYLKERIYTFLSKYKTDNELITYDHYCAYEMANFIHCNLLSINKSQLTTFICSSKQFSMNTLYYFIQLFSFTNYHLTEALRLLLKKLLIIKEPQIIHHILLLFSNKYCRDNINSFKFPEQTLTIVSSAIELSEEISTSNNGINKTMSDYIEKVKSMNKNKIINLTYLCDVYNKIIANPILISYFDTKQNILIQKIDDEKDANMPKQCLIEVITKLQYNPNENNRLYYYIDIRTEDIANLIQCSWSNYLGIFSQMITEFSNEQIIQKCINNILTVARISGILHLFTISETFINTIINYTSLNEMKDLQLKNIQSLRSLLSFVLANGRYISSWYLILSLLSKIDYYNSESLSQLVEKRIEETLSKHIPYQLIESIYSCTILFPSKQLNNFMLALCDVVKNEISTQSNRTFSLHKIIEVANFNLFRQQNELENIWKIIYESFISLVIEYKNDQLPIVTNIIDSLRQIAIKFLNKGEIRNTFQLELFNPFEKLFNQASDKEDSIIPEMILECLISISNFSPIIIGSGWIIIFDILKSAVKRKERNIYKLLSSVLKPFDDNLLYYTSKKDIFISYVRCLCYLCLFNETKEYSSMQISNTQKLLFQNEDITIQHNIKYILYGFDEVIKVNPISYLELLFEFLINNINIVFLTNQVWDYYYHSYFKVYLITFVLFYYVNRLNYWPRENNDEFNYEFKEEVKDIHSNVILYLNKTSQSSIIKSQDYKNDFDLIENLIELIKKYDWIQYTTLLEGFINNLVELISKASNQIQLSLQFYTEDIIISLLQLSLFNKTPEPLFNVIQKRILSCNTHISEKGWKKIALITFNILDSISNLFTSITESQMKDIIAYSYYFSSFYQCLIINHYQEIELTKEDHKRHYSCCNRIMDVMLIIDQQNNNTFKEFKIINSPLALGTLNNMTICKTLILDMSPNVFNFYDKGILFTLTLLNKSFVLYLIEKTNNDQFNEVIQIELRSILSRFIEIINKEDIKTLYTCSLNILLSSNKTLRQSAKYIIESLIENKMISFTSVDLKCNK